jgi:hypothetical protein
VTSINAPSLQRPTGNITNSASNPVRPREPGTGQPPVTGSGGPPQPANNQAFNINTNTFIDD